MKFKKLGLVALTAACATTLASCGVEGEKGVYIYNTYTTLTPSNWNELTYQDENDTDIIGYISSSFFSYDFKFDSNGEIVPGEYEVEYSAATGLEDVTANYVGETWGIKEGAKGQAYKITLRQDLKWEDGEAITADDFVYTMKEQLNPLFKNYRGDSYFVGATVIHNARNYYYQGSVLVDDNADTELYSMADLVKGADGVYTTPDGRWAAFAIGAGSSWCSGNSLAAYVNAYGSQLFDVEKYKALAALMDEDGYVAVTDDSIAKLTAFLDASLGWGESAANAPMYLHYEYEYPTVDFANVGLFKGSNDYELIIVLDKPLQLLKEDGSLDYKAAYNFGGLPLVQESKYEQYKVAPVEGSNLWTTTYNQSVESTSSWGPYKLVEFQAGKQYILAKNENWYGYNMEEYAGQYQTDKIVCEQVADWNTAWLKFLAGEVDSVGIDVSVAADYKNSEQAIYTPSDFVSSLQLQSSKESLKTRQEEMGAGYNKVLLSYTDFRKALSLGINRAEFANQVTTSSKAGFGLFNSMHYYDVANGGVYRNEDVAKQVLCDIYGVDATKYPSLSAAEEAITGFDLEQARALVNKAVAEAKAAGDYKEGDVVALEFGTGSITEGVTRQFEFIKGQWTEMLKGTDLEGKLELTLVDHQEAWANDFRGGGYEVCMGGFSGAAWDPGYFLLAYLSPDYMYSAAWETDKVTMDFDADGDGKLETMSLLDWYDVLNGAHSEFNWGSGFKPESERLALIAALEKEVLSVYYTVPLVNSYSASLVSYKWDYITTEYNTFMGYGGIRYATYNYDDYEWAKYVKKNKGQLDYKG